MPASETPKDTLSLMEATSAASKLGDMGGGVGAMVGTLAVYSSERTEPWLELLSARCWSKMAGSSSSCIDGGLLLLLAKPGLLATD